MADDKTVSPSILPGDKYTFQSRLLSRAADPDSDLDTSWPDPAVVEKVFSFGSDPDQVLTPCSVFKTR